jgi:mannose-6-phosphate isomerase-like protein (cupin superfamily)
MRTFLIAATILAAANTFAQTAPAPQQPATQRPPQQPAPARPAPARPAAAASRAGIAITVTDPTGFTIPDVRVEILGSSDRSGATNQSGQVNFTQMQAGTYRLRFSGESVIAFEKEVTLRAGQIANLDVTLNAAAAPPPPPPPPPAREEAPPAPPPVGPAGQPLAVSIIDLAERQAREPGNAPRRESLVSCSGNTRTTVVQLNQDQPQRLYDTAEVTYYVVAGQGALRVDGRDSQLQAGTFVSIPRGTAHTLVRRGNRPLIVVTTVAGSPCEEPR